MEKSRVSHYIESRRIEAARDNGAPRPASDSKRLDRIEEALDRMQHLLDAQLKHIVIMQTTIERLLAR